MRQFIPTDILAPGLYALGPQFLFYINYDAYRCQLTAQVAAALRERCWPEVLAESRIERGIERQRRDSQPRRRQPVVVEMRLKPVVALVNVDVGQPVQFPHFRENDGAPGDEILQIVAPDCVLILRCAHPAADSHVLARLQDQGRSGDFRRRAAQAVDDLVGGRRALARRYNSRPP
jgi:hypothetical protein